MTRKELSQVYYLKKELSMWEAKLSAMKEKSLVKSKEVSDMPRSATNGCNDDVYTYVSQIIELQNDIEIFKMNINKKVEEIEHYIMSLDDSLLRQIIEYRCCQCKPWQQVSMLIGYGTTEDSVKKYFNRKFPK